jgi:hypothetical protein
VSRATGGYALLWIGVIGARAAFSFGAVHWFPKQPADWCVAYQAQGAAITDGLIFMAVAMLVTRTIGLAFQASRLPSVALASQRGVMAGARG